MQGANLLFVLFIVPCLQGPPFIFLFYFFYSMHCTFDRLSCAGRQPSVLFPCGCCEYGRRSVRGPSMMFHVRPSLCPEQVVVKSVHLFVVGIGLSEGESVSTKLFHTCRNPETSNKTMGTMMLLNCPSTHFLFLFFIFCN